jgi:UDP-4-amino-4-deoxy-L-arabinose formyltransferase/UDP-glucuronic acid dehydrogenase (UDP-4-keto-hexauronic acid decarboxylating)
MSNHLKVLLLGAGGFIGANLTERLLADGKYDVTAIDIDSEKIEEPPHR